MPSGPGGAAPVQLNEVAHTGTIKPGELPSTTVSIRIKAWRVFPIDLDNDNARRKQTIGTLGDPFEVGEKKKRFARRLPRQKTDRPTQCLQHSCLQHPS